MNNKWYSDELRDLDYYCPLIPMDELNSTCWKGFDRDRIEYCIDPLRIVLIEFVYYHN